MRRVLGFLLIASVAQAGTLRGRVSYAGKERSAGRIAIHKDNRTCGDTQPDESLEVDGTGGLANAVVFVEGAPPPASPASSKQATIDQRGCHYLPHVQAVQTGTELVAINSDPVLHTVHGWLGPDATAFNQAMPIQGMKQRVRLDKPGLIKVGCDAGHTWMTAWVQVFDHPYFAVTRPDGSFEIDNLPPGRWTLKSWHERLGLVQQSITIRPGQDAVSNLRYR